MSSVFFNKGENCISAGRLFVEDKIHDEFVRRVVKDTKTITIGSFFDFKKKICIFHEPEPMKLQAIHLIGPPHTGHKITKPTSTNCWNFARKVSAKVQN